MNSSTQTDPTGGLTIGLIGVAWGIAVFLFHERLFFSKRARFVRWRKWEKRFFQIVAGVICFGGGLMAVENAWILLVHR
jgi:hypothetical protein